MKRREFLRDSAIAAGTLASGLSFGEANANPKLNPVGTETSGAIDSLIEVPGTSFEITDDLTKVPVTVTLGKFLMSPTQITQKGYEEITGENPSFHRRANLPVETVSWWEAIRYCNLRSTRENLEPCYNLETGLCDMRKNGYRLPSDIEWSHASGDISTTPAKSSANLGNADTKHVRSLVDELNHSGTQPAGSYPANQYGLCDMVGNVWEWCTDYFNPLNEPQSSYNSAGPLRGLSRIVRGGSFVSTTSQWARDGYRGCIEPEYKSRFTGFRVCRTLEPDPALPAAHRNPNWFAQYNQAPAGYETSTGNLSSLVAGIGSVSEWQRRRATIQKKWLKLLGSMDVAPPPTKTRLISVVEHQNYTAKLMYLQVEPDWWEKILVMMPAESMTRPRPVVIVPFYDVDTSAARNLSGNDYRGSTLDPYAYCAVQKGYIAVAIRWWGESYGEFWSEAVANLQLRHPNVTGLGKWVWDARRLVDYIYTLPEVDRANIGIIGHSLGGKMSLYAAAFDDRIAAVVSNEPGIGLTFSNYDDYWYLGDAAHTMEPGTDQHELIAMIAPRPFLLIGGDKFDTKQSWYYINAARSVYQIYGKPQNIGYFNHHTGHSPTPDAIWRMNEWLAHFLGPQA